MRRNIRRFLVFFTVLIFGLQATLPAALVTSAYAPAGAIDPAAPPAFFSSPAVPIAVPQRTGRLSNRGIFPFAPLPSFTVRTHPDGALYVGDLVSLEVIAPDGLDLKGDKIHIQVAGNLAGYPGADLGMADFGPFGIAGRYQATFTWVWNTAGLAPGDYQLTFSIESKGITWEQILTLLPENRRPAPEPKAHWATVETKYCVIHYITGTAAARDIDQLEALADRQAEDAIQRFGIDFSKPIPITIVPRVLGHGGFAGNEIYVSYLDRNYAGNDFALVLHHEMIHILDGRLGGELRPSLFVEGLAVYLSDGHFKIEPFRSRAAVLLDLGWYIPLPELADNFYKSQHEIGYLEGAALIQYMVDTWGWNAFNAWYRDIHPDPSGVQSVAIDKALQAHFGLTFAELESRFLTELHRQRLNPDMISDVELTVDYFDTVRRYQQTLDPSAYFLTAWLPDGEQMRKREIVADFLRHPNGPENKALEGLLIRAEADLLAGNYQESGKVLGVVNGELGDLVYPPVVATSTGAQ